MDTGSRRDFLRTTGITATTAGLFGIVASDISGISNSAAARDIDTSQQTRRLDRRMIETEISRRAAAYLAQRRLVVDYYRIGRRLAYPLPVESLSLPKMRVPSIKVYPWSIWMMWELEERIGSLAWAGQWLGNKTAKQAASVDLAALTRWPKYAQLGRPDLSSGHAGRLMWRAFRQWSWLGDALRKQIRSACRRHVDEILPGSNKLHGKYTSKDQLLAAQSTYLLHNIPLIGTIGAALTAQVAQHPAAKLLNHRVAMIFEAILDKRNEGHAEGVGYDGYVLDFIADWLSVVDERTRQAILIHPRLGDYLDESYILAAPGTAENVAALSDVEPREMPFHLSAQAKLAAMQPNPIRSWHLARCRANWLRVDALAALHPSIDRLVGRTPKAGALNAHYAIVLRSGWTSKDLAVAIACSTSAMSHIQCDNGSLVIGTQGRWPIADPGYQQYVKGAEREYTLGPIAHNAPVINGACQNRKAPRLVSLRSTAPNTDQAVIELTDCYPTKLQVQSVVRTVWRADTNLVVVADRISGNNIHNINYYWHGHRAASWWSNNGWLLVHLPDTDIWFTSPQTHGDDSNVERLAGSRGQLTLTANVEPKYETIWWVFALAAEPPIITTQADGKEIEVCGQKFRAG